MFVCCYYCSVKLSLLMYYSLYIITLSLSIQVTGGVQYVPIASPSASILLPPGQPYLLPQVSGTQ